MSNITEHNIEELMFDYVEGNLSATEKAAVDNFIQENPQYATDLQAWQQSFVTEPEQDYPLADQLLAGSKGSIWLRWGLGLLLLGATASGAWWFTMGEVDADTTTGSAEVENSGDINSEFKTNTNTNTSSNTNVDEPSTSASSNSGQASSSSEPSSASSNASTNGSSSNASATNSGKAWASSSFSVSHKTHKADRGSSSDAKSKESDDLRDESLLAYSEPVPEISPYEVSGGYGDRGYVLEKLALFEAMDYFDDNAGASANRNRYDGTMDEMMEKSPTAVYRESFITKMMDKISEKVQQPLGLSNSSDQYFILPDYHSPILENSAFAGGARMSRLKMSSRARWLSTENTRLTGSVVYDTYIKKWNLGIGGSFRVDDFENGMYRNYSAGLHLSPKFQLDRHVWLEPAIGVSLNQREANWSKITPGSKIEYDRGDIVQTYTDGDSVGGGSSTYMNFDAGLLLNTRYFYLGVSTGNILTPDVNVYNNLEANNQFPLPRTFSVQLGSDYQYTRDGTISMSPHIIYNQTGRRSELWSGMYARLDWFLVGAALSNRLNYVGMIGFQGRGVRIAYNLDMTESSYEGGKRMPSHSISARFIFKQMKRPQGHLQFGLSGEDK